MSASFTRPLHVSQTNDKSNRIVIGFLPLTFMGKTYNYFSQFILVRFIIILYSEYNQIIFWNSPLGRE